MESTKQSRRKTVLTAVSALGLLLSQPLPGAAQSGAVTQLPRPLGCTAEDGDGINCADGVGLEGASDVAISPDGRSIYVPGFHSDSLAVFSRNVATGALTQLPGPDGCFANGGDGVTCTPAPGLLGATSVAVSPDGKHVYAGSLSGLAVFARDTTTGQLTQLPGPDGCLLQFGGAVTGCTDIVGPIDPAQVVVSRDGKHVYVSGFNGDAIAIFSRNRTTGVLTQLPAPAGCLAENGDGVACTDAVGLDGPDGIALSRNGKQVYVAAGDSKTIAVFARDRTTGALTQFPAPNGCLAEDGDGVTCTAAVGLDGARGIAISRTGRQLYVASGVGDAIAIFARNAATGVLTQLPAPHGCLAAFGDGVTCTQVLMNGPTSIALTENGRHAYVTAVSSSVVAFARDKKTGALSQLPAPAGCVSVFGDGVSCTNAVGMSGPMAIAMPTSGKHVYVAAYSGNGVTAFLREK